jgi:hypothetical protein
MTFDVQHDNRALRHVILIASHFTRHTGTAQKFDLSLP